MILIYISCSVISKANLSVLKITVAGNTNVVAGKYQDDFW
ncbi:hypothetical protein RINTHH_12910 [Richelia intracellularis HH01]|uniref:Uncharacterized protein n=1 Tax=Richelia intracellularis HH01 TaxID=1165094 RepID=M1X5L4_9NOST|nr:hypothetical protein RINTHH_12910 [Richelia intracellularis HH01]